MKPDTTSTPTPVPIDSAAFRLLARLVIPTAGLTAFADFLFWDAWPGLNIGAFFLGLAAVFFGLSSERPRAITWVLAVMLVTTCVQSAIALSLSNVIAAIALALALGGNLFQPHLRSFWARFSEMLFGVFHPIRRWGEVIALFGQAGTSVRMSDRDFTSPIAFAVKTILPAAGLLAIFGGIFAAGNAAFGDLLARAGTGVWVVWEQLDISALRVLWWCVIATVALSLVHATRAPEKPRWWTLELPRFPRNDARLATWQTGLALLAMNALFFLVNTLDAIFLWGHSKLPDGVSASAFLHAGVNNLITAVVLSALVIAGMFQQEERVSRNRWLKRLSHLWVIQNLLLIGGVLRRVMIYAEEYQLTEKRVYVCCFLLLVTTGFLLLAWFVQKRKSFNWLLGQNTVATFSLFFILQFVDVRGAVARHNVDHWVRGADIDVEYLATLGPTAWPELIRVARTTSNEWIRQRATALLSEIYNAPRREDWRSYQFQEARGFELVASDRRAAATRR